MKDMATRALVQWPDDTYTYPDLDYTYGELVRVSVGWLLASLALIAFILAPLVIAGVAFAWFGW